MRSPPAAVEEGRLAEVVVEVSADDSVDAGWAEEIERAVAWAIAEEGRESAIVSVALLDDQGIATLNLEYLSHEGPTDVISFPLDSIDDRVVGDIYIGVEQARRQALELGADFRQELVRLAIHGALHVLGWEHPDGPERIESPMFARQEELVDRWFGGTEPV